MLSLNHYVEWQISYDLLSNVKNESKTTLSYKLFLNYKDVDFFIKNVY